MKQVACFLLQYAPFKWLTGFEKEDRIHTMELLLWIQFSFIIISLIAPVTGCSLFGKGKKKDGDSDSALSETDLDKRFNGGNIPGAEILEVAVLEGNASRLFFTLSRQLGEGTEQPERIFLIESFNGELAVKVG